MKKIFIVLEPEELVKLQDILLEHDTEEAWNFLQFTLWPKIKKEISCLDGRK
ncbi:MAG: hypothetical protein XD63_1463 [Thermoanaerobacterales bacterium 50_218]|jgi:hypothetical protein|nr:MAG: hypothetical protein XD63_1463 [Thermoanaerobacterales bacterium 50_218]